MLKLLKIVLLNTLENHGFSVKSRTIMFLRGGGGVLEQMVHSAKQKKNPVSQ